MRLALPSERSTSPGASTSDLAGHPDARLDVVREILGGGRARGPAGGGGLGLDEHLELVEALLAAHLEQVVRREAGVGEDQLLDLASGTG